MTARQNVPIAAVGETEGRGSEGDKRSGAGGFGVYIHVPFCTRRCDYCAFATWTDRFHLVDDYLTACSSELRDAVTAGMPQAGSVFFGGGTPSLLRPDQIAGLLSAVPLLAGAEVTVECNPDTVDTAKLAGYRSAGVTRLSFGVQSMVPGVLASLGRSHDPSSVIRAAEAAGAAGFAERYNVDLIFGAAGEAPGDWEATLVSVLSLDPPPLHVSAYALTVEAGTPLSRDYSRHPDPDDQADKYVTAEEILRSAGLEWYEISNWSRPGEECRHNQLYWSQGEYVGIGCAAHSHRVDQSSGTARRWWNIRTPERYTGAVASGRSPAAGGEELGVLARRRERLELSIRTREGVPEVALPAWCDDPDLDGLVEPVAAGRLALTVRGRLLANEVALRLETGT
jgi:oxygen-independent coproporphyrinogen-3 oxidase